MVGDILQPTHLLLILVVALLVLGPKRLPEAARTLGNGLRDFRSAISGESRDDAPRTILPQDTTPAPTVEPASVVHTPEAAAAPIHEPTPDAAHAPAAAAVHETPAPAPVVPEPAPPEHPAGPSDAGTSPSDARPAATSSSDAIPAGASPSDATPSEASAGAASEHSG